METDSIDTILDFAIQKEQGAADFYTNLAKEMARGHMQEIFRQFAEEEKRHKAKLIAAKKGKVLLSSAKKIQDLKISDHLIEIDAAEEKEDMTYQKALIIAMQAEKKAYKLYMDLAGAAQDSAARELFLSLANEEAKHKLRFEIEYDETILNEN